MITHKKCSGNGKAIGYGCGALIPVEKRKYGLGIDCCYKDWLLNSEAGKEKLNKSILHAKKETKKTESLENKQAKEKLKTLSDWKNDLQKEINTIVRLIDKGWPCIATGSYEGKMNAGHYISIGSNDTLRFHLSNIWLQSEHSNSWKSGDTLRYQEGITNLLGKEYLEYMNSLQSIQPIKITAKEIKEKIYIARSIVKWLKLQDRKFDISERIFLRKQFNHELGIYLETQ